MAKSSMAKRVAQLGFRICRAEVAQDSGPGPAAWPPIGRRRWRHHRPKKLSTFRCPFENATNRTKLAKGVVHIVVISGKTLKTEVEPENPVDSSRQATRIVSVRRQTES